MGWEPVVGYAGAGVLIAFALALITIFAIGVILA